MVQKRRWFSFRRFPIGGLDATTSANAAEAGSFQDGTLGRGLVAWLAPEHGKMAGERILGECDLTSDGNVVYIFARQNGFKRLNFFCAFKVSVAG